MLYNNPGNTACTALSAVQIAELVEDDVVHMVKSTMESVVPVHDLSLLVGDKMRIFYGSFLSAYEALTAGAHGWTSGILNIVTRTAIEMYRAVTRDKDIDAGLALWKRILPIVHLYTREQLGPASDIPIYRGILELWGRQGGFSRSPFLPLSRDQMKRLAERLSAAGWLQGLDRPGHRRQPEAAPA
jgi:4-hydroxy-tetrahydrodipicolinate synthase